MRSTTSDQNLKTSTTWDGKPSSKRHRIVKEQYSAIAESKSTDTKQQIALRRSVLAVADRNRSNDLDSLNTAIDKSGNMHHAHLANKFSSYLVKDSSFVPHGDWGPHSVVWFHSSRHTQIQDLCFLFRLDPYASALIPNAVDKWVLRPLPMSNPLAQSHATRIIRMLRSFPHMMARRETFAPFIHPHWQSELPEALANCISIAQMFCSRDSSSSTLVWRTIRLEQERLAAEMHTFSKNGFLAALQCYLIYMIMLVHDDSGQTPGDVSMLMSLKVSLLSIVFALFVRFRSVVQNH